MPNQWTPPNLTLKWGPYTKPDPEEQQKIVTSVVAARGNGGKSEPLITRRAAVEKLKETGVFGIENVGAFLQQLDEEREEKQAREDEKSRQQLESAKLALAEANTPVGVGGAGANPKSQPAPKVGDSGGSQGGKNDTRRNDRRNRR